MVPKAILPCCMEDIALKHHPLRLKLPCDAADFSENALRRASAAPIMPAMRCEERGAFT